jgi:integrase
MEDRFVRHWIKYMGGKEPTFEELYRIIKANLEEYYRRIQVPNPKRLDVKRFIYFAIALLQLTNGLRASEAIYALKEYLIKGNKSFTILAEKSNKERWVYIPDTLVSMTPTLKTYLDIVKSVKRQTYYSFLHYNVGINPHTLRYVFIDKAIRKMGVGDTIVYMGYASPKHLMEYYRTIRAKEKLMEFVKELTKEL